jgi:L-threonylcarbamoyladenylate synthase
MAAISDELIAEAVAVLRRGGLVAFPTETVYGLGADATNAGAVKRIFEVKGRPPRNPLIVHVPDAEVARRYAREWPEAAERLAGRFWPGPLTMVLPMTDEIDERVTAGGDTVGLRVPAHPVALALLRGFGGPVAAPSANRSNHVSPTTAQHVRDDLGDRVDLILDGGPCAVGIESTVLDLTEDRPRILRPGGASKKQIEAVLGVEVEYGHVVSELTAPAMSPGQQEVHYAPRTPAYRVERGELEDVPGDAGVIRVGEVYSEEGNRIVLPESAVEYARDLYQVLRGLDARGLKAIYIEMPPDEPEWAAVRDRITRATRAISPA